jgi:hypothetical protein
MLANLRCLLVAFVLAVAGAGCAHNCPDDCDGRPFSDLFSCCDNMCYCADWMNCHSCVNRGCHNGSNGNNCDTCNQ